MNNILSIHIFNTWSKCWVYQGRVDEACTLQRFLPDPYTHWAASYSSVNG